MSTDTGIQDHLAAIMAQRAEGQVIAFFDMDRTLILGHSATAFAWEALQSRRSDLARIAREILGHLERRPGGQGATALYRQLLSSLAGTADADLKAVGRAAYERSLAASIFREARQIVQRHRLAGHRLVMISAATHYQAESIAEDLGFDELVCTRPRVADGILTGAVEGDLCYGEGKLIAARRLARQSAARLDDAWFYTDSRHDLPLLKKVGNPVPTNPSDALQEYAAARGWPMLTFSSRGKPNLESLLRTALTANTLLSSAAAGATSWLLTRSRDRAANSMSSWLGDLGPAFAGLEFEISGTPHLEAPRPAIFTFNHQSFLDSLVMAHLLRHDFVAFCKSEVADNPLLGPLLRAHGTIFVDRGARDQSTCIQQASDALNAGKSLMIAPEGTRSATGQLLPFKPGAFVLARRLGVPIVPVVLHNVADAMPRGSLLIRPATIRVSILPPVPPGEMGDARGAGRRLRQLYERELQDGLPQRLRLTNAEPVAARAGAI
jgi:putative phosphoserine phosphatase/1-acylglycerol-3-phosphate O-acyltransferase